MAGVGARAVLRELEAGAELDDTARRLRPSRVSRCMPWRPGFRRSWPASLILGEAAVIQLALDLPGATVVLDDLKARRVARRSSIPMTGSLGVLLHAKRRGKLDSLAQPSSVSAGMEVGSPTTSSSVYWPWPGSDPDPSAALDSGVTL